VALRSSLRQALLVFRRTDAIVGSDGAHERIVFRLTVLNTALFGWVSFCRSKPTNSLDNLLASGVACWPACAL